MSRIHVKVDGAEYDVEDLTLDETCRFEQATGASWAQLNPTQSALHCRAILLEFYSRTRSRSEAERAVGALSTRAAVEHIVIVDAEDDRPVEHRDGVPVVDPKTGPAGTATT